MPALIFQMLLKARRGKERAMSEARKTIYVTKYALPLRPATLRVSVILAQHTRLWILNGANSPRQATGPGMMTGGNHETHAATWCAPAR